MATHSSILDWENSVDRGAWPATAHQVAKSWTQWSNVFVFFFFFSLSFPPLMGLYLSSKMVICLCLDAQSCYSLRQFNDKTVYSLFSCKTVYRLCNCLTVYSPRQFNDKSIKSISPKYTFLGEDSDELAHVCGGRGWSAIVDRFTGSAY